MQKTLIAALLAAAAPLAQAQQWTQVVESATPNQFLSLAPERALDVDGQGLIFVQTENLRAFGAASIDVHALDNRGRRLTTLRSPLPSFNDGEFVARGISARNGHRVNWIESGPPGSRRDTVFLYLAGQSSHYRSLSFQNGSAVTHALSNGTGNAYIAYRSNGLETRPRLTYYGANHQYWSRNAGGCPGGDNLPAHLLAFDFDANAGLLTAVSRCADASSAGTIAIQSLDPQTGATLAVRHGWPYDDGAAPVVAAQPIGYGHVVLEQHDAVTGERWLRQISIDSDHEALALPTDYQPQPVARYTGGAFIPAINTAAHAIGAWRFSDKGAVWVDFPALSGDNFPYLPGFPPTRFAWSGDAAGNTVAAFKLPVSHESGPVQVVAMHARGGEMWRRSIDGYAFTQQYGNVALAAVPDSDEVVLVADEYVWTPGYSAPTGVIHVEQFRIDDSISTIPCMTCSRP